jgi:hypothetical protein
VEVGETVADGLLNWELVRLDFEGDRVSSWEICRKYGLSPATLTRRAKEARWGAKHRNAGLDRDILIAMLFGVLEQQLRKLEVAVGDVNEKEAAVLGKLVATMEKLIEIEGRTGSKAAPADTREMRDLRNKLASRIDRLKQG